MILPFVPHQPRPVETLVAVMGINGVSVTGITRLWKEGDCERCQLCKRCVASHNVCMIMVTGAVAPEDAPLFDLVDFHAGDDRRPDLFGRSSRN